MAVLTAVFGGLSLIGIRDLLQKRHAVLRNYPISAHLRFIFEELRPEMRGRWRTPARFRWACKPAPPP
jgi:hypothetical protein